MQNTYNVMNNNRSTLSLKRLCAGAMLAGLMAFGASQAYAQVEIHGSVFGGGKGKAESAADRDVARVGGNTLVNISAGRIHGNVYGGGQLASVGKAWADIEDDGTTPIVDYEDANAPKSADYGNTKVLISGGQIGDLTAHIGSGSGKRKMGRPLNEKGYVFGGGKGMVDDNDWVPKFAFIDSSYIEISGGRIAASLFGGGENGHVRFSTYVKVSGTGIVGRELADADGVDYSPSVLPEITPIDSIEHREINGQGAQEIYFGNVYGGGRGIEFYYHETEPTYSPSAGHVYRNTHVEIIGGRVTHNVYGGGSLASVGLKNVANTGTATVNITAGVIGYDDGKTTFTAAGAYSYDGTPYADLSSANKQKVKDFYLRAGINEGSVYGSGRGQVSDDEDIQEQFRNLAFVKNTVVNIGGTAQVRGSVFGGGANGHVRQNTDVTIAGSCLIGVPLMNMPDWNLTAWPYNEHDGYVSHDTLLIRNYNDTKDTLVVSKKYYDSVDVNFNGAHLHERWIATDGEVPIVYRGNVYGGGRGISPTETGGGDISTFHYSATAGRVYGNVVVKLNGGTVFHDVYGGGSLASVGNAVASIDGANAIGLWGNAFTKADGFVDSIAKHENNTTHDTLLQSYTRDYRVGDPVTGTGNITVTLNGTTIGTDGIGNGDLFGGGRGIAGGTTADVTHLAFVNNTYVFIKNGTAKGSAFGGGANGHVSQNTFVFMNGGQVGERLPLAERKVDEKTGHGYRVYRGNLYGGGRGVDPLSDGVHLSATAGRVYGNTRVCVIGGKVYHSVFGGGSLASVGSFSVRNFSGTKRHLYIQGTGQAVVTIGGNAVVGNTSTDLESAFSGSDADVVTVKSMLHLLDDEWKDLSSSATDTKWSGLSSAQKQQYFVELNYHFMGSNSGMVFGSGRGVSSLVNGVTIADYANAAFTRNTVVTVKDGTGTNRPVIVGSVFGGGENGHVKHDTYVHINGGNIGGIPLHNKSFKPGDASMNGIEDATYEDYAFSTDGTLTLSLEYEDSENHFGHGPAVYRGNVYGGGRGVDHSDSDDPEESYSATAGRVYGNAEVLIDGGVIFHNVFGGGSLASVGTFEYVNDHPVDALSVYEYKIDDYDAGHVTSADREKNKYAPRRGGFVTDGSEDDSLYVLAFPSAGDIKVTVEGGQVGCIGVNEGSVFGGGRGIAGANNQAVTHMAYCDSTTVLIKPGAKINGNVFGGGANGHVLESTIVTMTGGTVGYPLTAEERTVTQYGEATKQVFHGNVYGGGRGVDPIQSLAGESDFSYTAGRVYGNSNVTITAGTVAHNVYGGGSLATVGTIYYKNNAGDVANDGKGSSLAPTAYDPYGTMVSTTGQTSVTIGGTAEIGTDGMNNGNVFGSCRGISGYNYSNRAYVYNTAVTIDDGSNGKPYIKGSVFGSGENGHVEHNTVVTINGGTIGQNIASAFSTIDAGAGTAAEKAAAKRKYDYIGNVYGGGRGVDTYMDTVKWDHDSNPATPDVPRKSVRAGHTTEDSVKSEYSYSAGYVRGATSVTVTGGTIHRNVYGGGSMGLVGSYGVYGDHDYYRVSGNSSSDAPIWVGSPSDADFWTNNGGTATVAITGATIGSSANVALGYGGNVYGSSRGRANDATKTTEMMPDGITPLAIYNFAAMAYVTRTHVTINDGSDILGNVYGGGENGHVDWGGTTVNIHGGKVRGNVFGGGRGNTSSPTAGIIDGPTTVNIGQPLDVTNTVEILGDVFGGNDTWSSPLGTMTVNVYCIKHEGANVYPLGDDPTDEEKADALAATDGTASKYALHAVYGGGNEACVLTGVTSVDSKDGNPDHVLDSLYKTERIADNPSAPTGYKTWPATTNRKSVVHIYGCKNTIMYVYGGGNAANTIENDVTIDGGRIYRVFAGGNGEGLGNPGANVGYVDGSGNLRSLVDVENHGDASVLINGGIVKQVFGGSNTLGYVYGTSTVEMDETPVCPQANQDIYGGGNEAPGKGDIVVTVPCGAKGLHDIYGGANMANFTGNITFNIEGGEIEHAFGGSRSANIDGNVTVNVYGGHIDELYGGNDVSGTITGTITVNVDWGLNNCIDPTYIGYVYGGGRNAPYEPTAAAAVTAADDLTPQYSPVVNIIQANVTHAVFGGGNGQGKTGSTDDAHIGFGNTASKSWVAGSGYVNPMVVIGKYREGNREGAFTPPYDEPNNPVRIGSAKNPLGATLDGNVFGGGNQGPVYGNPKVVIQGSDTKVWNNVYGGGNSAIVLGSPTVEVGADPRLSAPVITYNEGTKKVTMASHEEADIYYTYTEDGSEPATPTTSDNKYTGTLSPTAGKTVKYKAVAYRSDMPETPYVATAHPYSNVASKTIVVPE